MNFKILNYMIIFASVLLLSCDYDNSVYDNWALNNKDEIIESINSLTDSELADGYTCITIEAKIPKNSEEEFRKIEFSTSGGELIDAVDDKITVDVDAEGVASVKLKSLKAEEISVTAKVLEISKSIAVNFVQAPPERIDIYLPAFVLHALDDSFLEFSAVLSRDKGTPSLGNIVKFSALDSTGSNIGNFGSDSQSSDSSGKVVCQYFVGSIPYRGKVDIIASVENNGEIIQGRKSLNIVD